MHEAWKYVEVANYVASLDRVIRWQYKNGEEKVPVFLEWGQEVEKFRKKHSNVGIYTSIFRFQDKDVDATRVGNLFFDSDSEDDINISKKEIKRVYDYFLDFLPDNAIYIYFTGSKGFHLEVDYRALGITPGLDIHKTFRSVFEELLDELNLATFDSSVYDARRMWRLENSQHQKTGLHKVRLPYLALKSSIQSIRDFAAIDPFSRPQIENTQPEFCIEGNRWYKERVATYEMREEREKEDRQRKRAELFGKMGTAMLGGYNQKFLREAWDRSFEALKDAEMRNVTLNKEAFKMYVLYLRSNLPLEEVTSKLYEIAIGIGLEDRETNATLKSAERAAYDKYQEFE